MSGELCPPLLVRIQSVDINSLDFQCSSATTKSRHVTYVEATNLFLFVGCTSGTVYVFSRDSLKFLFMIPFKGGKVTLIACTLDESDVAVASIRGRVSVYRISPNIHFMQSTSNSSSPGEAFRHLYDVPHHVQNEITEMQWSPNGKYLFIGDSQGLISQVDVASLEEFPRPPPSKIILKLQSRILQIDCTFPYMAVCTILAVFLCDLEKEDFTRIQTIYKKSDVKSTGICLMVLQEDLEDAASVLTSRQSVGKMTLFVGEVDTGSIYQCNTEGTVILYKKVELAYGIQNPVTLFDPKVTVDSQLLYQKGNQKNKGDLNLSLGKMLSTDDGLLISVSSDRIFVYDPYTMNIILWNEDFNRIHSFKIIANYGFVWHGNKLDVLAFTPFKSYGKQLLKAGLNSVLESWINYAVYSVGWKNNLSLTTDNENAQTVSEILLDDVDLSINSKNTEEEETVAITLFQRMISPIEVDDDFYTFVSSHVPFTLIEAKVEPQEEETDAMRLEKAVNNLTSSVKLILNTPEEPDDENKNQIRQAQLLKTWIALETFYNDLGATLPQLDYKKSELTLPKVILSLYTFLRQPQLVNLKEDFKAADWPVFELLAKAVIKCFGCGKVAQKITPDNPELLIKKHCFTKYADCPVVIQYFKDLGVNSDFLLYDALLADTILLLTPITSEEIVVQGLQECLNLNEELPHTFFTWILLTSFYKYNKSQQDQNYGSLLRNIQNEQLFDRLAEDIITKAYVMLFQEEYDKIIHDSNSNKSSSSTRNTQIQPAQCFHHFISFVILFSKSLDMKPRGVNLLITLFPIKREVKIFIVEKTVQICTLNPYLLKMYYKACLEDGNLKLCDCGIPSSYGTLEDRNIIPAYQRGIEEAVLNVLIDNYLDTQTDIALNIDNSQDLLSSPMHLFAMKRCLIDQYMENPVSDEVLSERLAIRMILRSGACSALRHLKFNLENLKILVESLRKKEIEVNCSGCGQELQKTINSYYRPITIDCIGVWIVESVHSLDKFMTVVQKMNMNSKGYFSLSFYRFLIKRDQLKRSKKKEDVGFGDLVSLSNLTCSVLH